MAEQTRPYGPDDSDTAPVEEAHTRAALVALACPVHGPDHLEQIPGCPGRHCVAIEVMESGVKAPCGIRPCGRCGKAGGSWMSNRCDVCYRLDQRDRREREAQAERERWDEERRVRAERDELRDRVRRVLDWIGDCGCTCDADPDTPLSDHDSLCPGYVEHMLTSQATASLVEPSSTAPGGDEGV